MQQSKPFRITSPFGHIALNSEVSGDESLRVIKTDVIAFDANWRSVHPSFVAFHMEPAGIEHAPPQVASVREIVSKQIGWRSAEKLIRTCAVLAEHGVVDLRHALVFEDV